MVYYLKEKEDNMEKNNFNDNIIAGRNPVLEAIKSGENIDKIYMLRGEVTGSAVQILKLATDRKIVVSRVDKTKLDFITGTKVHQGVAAKLSLREYVKVEDIISHAESQGEEPFIIIAESIFDPHNLGAIIRSGCACGAHGIVISKHNGVGITPAVSKASAGTVSKMLVAKETNISATVEKLKKAGFWVYGLDAKGQSIYKTDFSGKIALLVGNEDKGISRLVSEKCDVLVSIPMKNEVESLNASVAASVLMYEIMRNKNI